MSALKGDFIGFTFGGVHSSELGIVRVSDGNRYTKNLLPSYSDKTIQVPGGDGTYYFGSNYTQKIFNISFAFDNVMEEQINQMQRLFGSKKIQDLIFDELPYKVYKARIYSEPDIKFLCFDEEVIGRERVYKGEGSISFIAYTPYAKSRFKYIEDYTLENIPEWEEGKQNINEWLLSSGIGNKGTLDIFNPSTSTFSLYNPGDINTDYMLYFNFPITGEIEVKLKGRLEDQLDIISMEPIGINKKFRINSKLNLIEGLNSENIITGNVYNKYIKGGNFFKIPQGYTEMTVLGATPEKIEYDYLYY